MRDIELKHRAEFTLTLRVCIIVATFSISSTICAQSTDSLDLKIGQMILIGLPEAEVDSVIREDFRAGLAGSLILFEKNVPKSSSFNKLKKIVWTYREAASVPLLVGIDQEGGRVNRLKEKYGFPRSISARAMRRGNGLDSVRFYAESTAATLAGLGINLNFAPVVDLAVNPQNTVIVKMERSFSTSEDTVAMMAREFIRVHRKFGVVTVLKHFPGHGSSTEDTHYGVADVTNSWSERELKPYRSLLDSNDVDAMMTAHIVNKKLDGRGYPGTLSNRIIDSLLRKNLGYQGVVFSDDMHMNAISKQYGVEEAIKLCINAGVDILCFSNNVQPSDRIPTRRIHGIIRKFVDNGEIKRERIDESYRRIMKLKSRLISNDEVYRQQLKDAQTEIANLKEENKRLRVKETRIEQKSPDQETRRKKKKKS